MAQQIGDLLKDKDFGEPPEVEQIKDFVKKEIGLTPKVSVTAETYILSVPSAAAAGTLRTNIFTLQKQLGTQKRILIRIA